MQLLLQYVQPHSTNITCARPLNVALRGVQHVAICTFQFRRPTRYDLHVSILQELFVVHLLFFKLERVPWFWVRKIEMVWGPRGVAYDFRARCCWSRTGPVKKCHFLEDASHSPLTNATVSLSNMPGTTSGTAVQIVRALGALRLIWLAFARENSKS